MHLQKRPSSKAKNGAWKRNSVCPTKNVKDQLEESSTEVQIDDSIKPDTSNEERKAVNRSSKDDIEREHEVIPDVIKDNSDWNILCDLSGVTWIDQAGCDFIGWIYKEQNVCGLVLPFHIKEVFETWPGCQDLQCAIYNTISEANSIHNIEMPRIQNKV